MSFVINNCRFCNQEVTLDNNEYMEIICPNCGTYYLTREDYGDLPSIINKVLKSKIHLISGYIRELNEIGNKRITISCDNIEQFYNNSFIPRNPIEKTEKILKYIFRKTTYFEETVTININETAIAYA